MSSLLKTQVLHGVKWSILAKGTTQLLSWVSTFLVIRWLSPEDYGVMALSMVFFTLISYFTTNGLTSVLIKEPEENSKLESQIFTFSLGLNIALSLVLLSISPWLSSYYNSNDLIYVMTTLAIINPVTSLVVVPMARLQRLMKFKQKSFIESGAALSSAITALVMAYAGFGYWSLVVSSCVMLCVRSVLYRMYTGPSVQMTSSFHGVKPKLAYAWNIQLSTLIWFMYNKVDTIILGKLLGMEKLGIYNVANDIASLPLSQGSAILNDVGFTAFSKVQGNIELAKHYANRSMFLISIMMFPVFYGIASVSEEVVMFVLGEKWLEAAPVITLLCLIFPFRMLSSLLTNFANGMGDAKFNLNNILVIAAVLISSITAGAYHGLNGAALGWVMGYSIAFIFTTTRFVCKYQFSWTQITPYKGIWALSSLMFVALEILPKYWSSPSLLLNLFVKMTIGFLIIVPATYFLYKEILMNLLKK